MDELVPFETPRAGRDDPTAPGDAPRAASEGLRPGDIVDGRYRVLRALDPGGMGDVYEAAHTALGHRVALKVPRRALADDPRFVARFLREGQAMQRVRHPHVVRALDCGNDGGAPYLATELLDGETLRAAMDREAPMPVARALARVLPLLDALAAVHAAGLVHRDVKPQNVVLARVDGAESPTLIDFGIAREADGRRGLTETGALLGTPSYMAPEQCRGDVAPTPAADQYAVAVVLYECLTGALPHEGDTPMLTMAARLTRPPASIAAQRGDLPPALAAAVMRALATSPEERFATVEAFRGALTATAEAPSRGVRRPALVAACVALAALVGAVAHRSRGVSQTRPVAVSAAPSAAVSAAPSAAVSAAPSVAVSVAPSVDVAVAPSVAVTERDGGVLVARGARSSRARRDPRLRMTIFREMR